MGLKIDASNLLERKYLKLKPHGIQFYGGGVILSTRNFTFREIDCVLLSPEGVLSFQVGMEVFSIEMRTYNPDHQAALAAFLAGLEATRSPFGAAGSSVRYS